MMNLEGIGWMPSPPLAPLSDAIDVDHLRRMTLGEPALEREVLNLFLHQSAALVGVIMGRQGNGAEAAHTLKGAARAIGAFTVAEAADDFEREYRSGEGERQLLSLQQAVIAAQDEIRTLLRNG